MLLFELRPPRLPQNQFKEGVIGTLTLPNAAHAGSVAEHGRSSTRLPATNLPPQ